MSAHHWPKFLFIKNLQNQRDLNFVAHLTSFIHYAALNLLRGQRWINLCLFMLINTCRYKINRNDCESRLLLATGEILCLSNWLCSVADLIWQESTEPIFELNIYNVKRLKYTSSSLSLNKYYFDGLPVNNLSRSCHSNFIFIDGLSQSL